jgi:adenosine kinase
MRRQVTECREMGLSLCYDIGQQVSNAPSEDMIAGLDAAEILILNDYELNILSKKTGRSVSDITSQVPLVITTFGPNGSRLDGTSVQQPIEIGVANPNVLSDPTGAGDAYRAGFLYGYARDWPLKASAQLGAVCASFAIETLGTQTHQPTIAQIAERYHSAFGEQPPFDE